MELELKGFRPIDEYECQTTTQTSAAEQCFIALDNIQADTFVVMTDEGPVALFGMVPRATQDQPVQEAGVCILWFLATPDLFTIKKDFMNQITYWLDWLQRFYPIGINHVSAENHVALKWCEAVGFKLSPPEPHGLNGEFFCFVVRTVAPTP